MSPKDKPRGYFQYLLAIDCETSGLFFNEDDPSFNSSTKEYYQAVSFGLVVANAEKLTPVEELYVEIQWDRKSLWSEKAESVHGLSKEYLDKHGISTKNAVEEIGNLIIKYWGPANSIRLLGHNVATFDIWFLRRLMRSEGINLHFGNRHVDTSTLGYIALNVFNSDDLFKQLGLPVRDKHNALDDAKYALETARRIRKIFNSVI
jgi:hypothetical protein